MSSATRARSLVVFYGGRCIAQLGVAPSGVEKVVGPGPICQQAMQGGRGNYLANLVLFPGWRWEGWVGQAGAMRKR